MFQGAKVLLNGRSRNHFAQSVRKSQRSLARDRQRKNETCKCSSGGVGQNIHIKSYVPKSVDSKLRPQFVQI